MLLENCYISGVENPLCSGNGSSPSGYINAINQGKAAILVTGAQEKGKTTSVKAAFKITPIDLSKVTLDMEAESAAYAVKGAIPVLTVKYDGKHQTDWICYRKIKICH